MARQSATLQESLRRASGRLRGKVHSLHTIIVAFLVGIASLFERLSTKLGGPVPIHATPSVIVDQAGSIDKELRALCDAANAAGIADVGSNHDKARAKRAVIAVQSGGDPPDHSHRTTSFLRTSTVCNDIVTNGVLHLAEWAPMAVKPAPVATYRDVRRAVDRLQKTYELSPSSKAVLICAGAVTYASTA